ncbi:MAG: response regulator transcription factor [Deltaproteobacteria bacterium]|nr:response regulator transcription factor [Deltaproteobacteria bacterium]
MEQKSTEKPNGGKIKILIADDHPVVVEGIIRGFEKEPDFEIVGTASDGVQAVKLVKTLKPDLVIMDISMPNMKGIDATHEIKTWNERIHVLIYTMYSEEEYITTLFRLGISAYILKREPVKEVVRAVKVVRDGGTYFSSGVRKVLQEQLDVLTMGDLAEVREAQNGIAKLSVREKELFVLLADGLRPMEIAKRLHISPKTVESHKYNIMEKLEVSTVAQLTKIAVKKNLIEI